MRDDAERPVQVAPIEFYSTVDQFVGSLTSKYLTPLSWGMRLIECTPFWSSVGLGRPWAHLNKMSSVVSKSLRLASLYCSYTLNEWIFDTTEAESLMGSTHPLPQRPFPLKAA